jgi:hypothetical protein
MVIEKQDPALVQIKISSKARPTALEEHITFTIIIYLQFIRWLIAGDFSEDSFMKLTTIHEFNKFMRKVQILATLSTSKCKRKRTYFAADACGTIGWAKLISRRTAALAAAIGGFLFLLPHG